MRFGVLGPLEVVDDHGRPMDAGGRQQRLVLAALIAAAGRPVGADSLIELLWPDRPPASAPSTLQSYVSRLRRLVSPLDGAQLVFEHGGYRLELPPDVVDVNRFDTLAETGREALTAGRPDEARHHLTEALEMWRGPALVDLTDHGSAIHQATSLEERRLAALEALLDADLALGQHELVVGELRMLAADHPFREGLHARLALALYRSGRQAEALRAIAEARRILLEEAGLDPGTALADLELAILEQHDTLDAPKFALPRPHREGAAGVFVGREAESAVLVAAYEAAVGDAQFVVVEGDPGIGKTRLADEVATRFAAQGSCVAWARSGEVDAACALRPWLDVVRTLSSQTDAVPPMLDELVSDRLPSLVDLSAGSQFECFEAIALLLERVGGWTPMVVVLDDIQWFDRASLDLLRFLATRLVRGVLVIATMRTLEIGQVGALTDTLGALARRAGNRRLRLSGLSRTATAQLVDSVTTGPVDQHRADHIVDRAEGNPFYTLELARLLAEPGSGDADIPATVADAVLRRCQQLDPATLDVLAVAAVVGREVNVPLVAAVADVGIDRCAELLDQAAAHRMLVLALETGKLRFAHALVREVLLDGLTPLRRAGLHLRVADALEQSGSDDIEVVADHLWRAAALGVGDRAASALEHAAEFAVGRVAYSTAEDLLRRAVELRQAGSSSASSDSRQALLDTELRLIAVMRARRYFSGTDRVLLRNAQGLAAELGHDEISRELAWSEWASLSRAADVDGARSSADRYRQRWASSPDPSVRASVSVVDGVTQWSVGAMTAAIAHLDRAAGLFSETAATASRVEQELSVIGDVFGLYCHAARGDTTPEDTLSSFERILAGLSDRAVDGRHQLVYALACRVAAVHTRWDALERFVRRAIELDVAGQFAFFDGQILLYRSLLDARDDRPDAALAAFADGRARFRAVSGRTGIATCQALLAEHMVHAGRLGDASTLAAGARHEVIDTGEAVNDIPVRIAEARVAAAVGDRAAASDHLAAAIRTGRLQDAHALAERVTSVAAELDLAFD